MGDNRTVLEIVIFIYCMAAFTHSTNATVQVHEIGQPNIGESLTLECSITLFTGTATWSHNGTLQATCGTSFCDITIFGNYTFSSSASGISVTINPVSSSDQGTWICTHSSGSDSYLLNPQKVVLYVVLLANCGVVLGVSLSLCACVAESLMVYFFSLGYIAHNYKCCGVNFMGIEILSVAAINQLVSLITTTIALSTAYTLYGKYALSVVIPISIGMIGPTSILGTSVYLLVVKRYCSKIGANNAYSFKKETGCKTVLLCLTIISPVAWIVIICKVVANQYKQSDNSTEIGQDRKPTDAKTIGEFDNITTTM